MEDPTHTFLAELHFLRDLAARVAQRYPLPGPLTVDLVRNTEDEGPPYRLTLTVGEGKDPFGSVNLTEPMLARCRSDLDLQRELTSRIMSAIELSLLLAPRAEAVPGPAFRARDPRFPLAVPVRITVQEAPGAPAPHRLEGLTANVSEGGVALDLPDRLEPWTPLSLRVEAEDGPVMLEVLVVWAAEPAAPGRPVRHGCIIIAVKPDQRETWRRLLRRFGYQRPYTRRHPRYPLVAPVWCSVEAVPAALEGEAENVSEGGLLIRLPLALAVGAPVQAALRLGGTVLERPARVIWVLGATGDDGRRIYRHGLELTGEPLPRDLVLQLYRLAQMGGGRAGGGRVSPRDPAGRDQAGAPGRRRFPRFELYLPTVIWSGGRELPGKAKDLGEGGLRLLLAEGLPVGTGGTLRLEGGTEAVQATARVVWLGPPEVSDLGARLVPHGLAFPTPLRRETVEVLVTAQIRRGKIPGHPRVNVRLPVEYQLTAPAIASYCLNISQGGIFIRTPDPVPLNREVIVRFRLPDLDREFRVHGRVVWSNPTPAANPFPPGMGIQFLGLEDETASLLGDYVEQLRARGGGEAEMLRPWYARPGERGKGR